MDKLCGICDVRPADPSGRPDANGVHWCRQCKAEFDAIDWDEIAERRQGL